MISKEIIHTIENDPQSLKDLLYGLGSEYLKVIDKNPDEIMPYLGDHAFWEAVYSQDGWGMDTMDAFRCLVDIERTRVLIQGIGETVKRLQLEGHQEITAIDAGTGTSILAIALVAFGCDKVHALEINENTAKAAQKFVDKLGLRKQIEVINCDATKINLGKTSADILVSENLSVGLFDEPQYYIINHLSNFLAPHAKIIPHSGGVYASVGSSSWEGIDRWTLAARRIGDLQHLSGMEKYAEVKSELFMPVPRVKGRVKIPIANNDFPINTLMISSRFQINEDPFAVYLEPDTAEFLGKSAALRLPSSVIPQDGIVKVSLSYISGMPRKESHIMVKGNTITLSSPQKWVRKLKKS